MSADDFTSEMPTGRAKSCAGTAAERALPRSSQPRRLLLAGDRGGFTLLELFLTLTVLLALSALVLPNFLSILGSRQLVRGADGFRNAMVDARVEAMRSGRPQILRVQLNGNGFALQPMYSLNDVTEAADQMGQGTAAAMGGMPVAAPQIQQQQQQNLQPPQLEPSESAGPLADPLGENRLPEGVVFGGVQVIANARSATLQQSGAVAGGDGWSQPIMFYADGTTSNAIVEVASEENGRVLIRLRGLTGETTVSEVMP